MECKFMTPYGGRVESKSHDDIIQQKKGEEKDENTDKFSTPLAHGINNKKETLHSISFLIVSQIC
ncbi:hypothetical protein MTBBW1_1940048 [Desulfamplus magnetovallimortis]|uniref:Uncharacterized protein n=1 Tax=Desulfamplus magnetovallimortis TaxID=1246637 RepID=A0A1W1HB45_9BACT|nr:hypothetical protein MTBBW1_1940048 [Desulfamplus magnetovallimortis]